MKKYKFLIIAMFIISMLYCILLGYYWLDSVVASLILTFIVVGFKYLDDKFIRNKNI